MPSTYTYQQLVDFAQSIVKGIPISTISPLAADQINSLFWLAYPWKWTRAVLTAIPLSDGVQDYAINGADTRFYHLLLARITRTDTTPDQYRDLRIFRHLEPHLSQKVSWPSFQLISYETEVSKLRLESAVSIPTGLTAQINGEYQMSPAKITALSATIVFPDHYASIFIDGLLWMLYRLANDKRAGTSVVMNRQVQYTGQLGTFYDGLVNAKEVEERNVQDGIYPEDSIGSVSFAIPMGL